MINDKMLARDRELSIPSPIVDHELLYFNFLMELIKGSYYDNLLELLHNITFNVETDSLDYNRYLDGLRLRERFFNETKGHVPMKQGPCTFLEMLIALAIRLDSDIMFETRFGDRSIDWFWKFIDNIGMTGATNDHWNPSWHRWVRGRCNDILRKRYKRDGTGGMFIVREHPDSDLRDCDIWRQMCWWVDENLKRGVIQ